MIDYDDCFLHLDFDEKRICIKNNEPSVYHRYDSGKLILTDRYEEEFEIGEFTTIRIDLIAALKNGMPYFDVFDCDERTISLYEELFDTDDEIDQKVYKAIGEAQEWNPNLLVIERLTINKEHRGRDYSLQAIKGLIQNLSMGIAVVVLKPFPLQFESGGYVEMEQEKSKELGYDEFEANETKATKKLIKHYAKLGFIKIPRTSYMGMNLEYKNKNFLAY